MLAVVAWWTFVWVLLFSIMLKSLSQTATTWILPDQCCPISYSSWLMNACNLTWAPTLEKGAVWLPKIRVINPHGSSFIISWASVMHSRKASEQQCHNPSARSADKRWEYWASLWFPVFKQSERSEVDWITFNCAQGETQKVWALVLHWWDILLPPKLRKEKKKHRK